MFYMQRDTHMTHALSRRQVLKMLMSAGGAGLVSACGASSIVDTSGATDTSTRGTRRSAIVIGSGFGGSVAALRLAQAGVDVTVLERGRAWPITDAGDTFCTSFVPDGRSTWRRDKTVAPLGPQFDIESSLGVLDRQDYDGMEVYTGAGVGGGSLVYGCMTVEPNGALFNKVFEGQLSFDEMHERWYPLVRQMLGASPVPTDIFSEEFYDMSRQFEAIGNSVGIQSLHIDLATDWDVVRAEMRGEAVESAIAGDLLYGGNSGYKQSLDRTYLPLAVATGNAVIQAQANVVGFERSPNGGWVVQVEDTDDHGAVNQARELEADMLFVCAGSTGTTEILLRAQAAGVLTGLEQTLGTRWGTNGNVMFMRSGLSVDTGKKQANPPVLAANYLDNPHTPIIVENAPFPIGIECNCLLQLAVSADIGRGRMELGSESGSLQLDWPEDGTKSVVDAVMAFSDQMGTADGGQMGGLFLPGPTETFTYHPLGGASMGSVCDDVGRVLGEPGLYVVDSALIPGSVGCANPSLTIAAVAERALEAIIKNDLSRVG
ncbi:MAG: cholesterol oxidase [Myxococcota bacterium]|jgi:cholesterol oxidase